MMTLTIPETEPQIKTPTSDRLGNVGTEIKTEPPPDRVAIVIQISMRGSCTLQILADHSDEYDRLNERITAVRPVIELLERMFTDERLINHSSDVRI